MGHMKLFYDLINIDLTYKLRPIMDKHQKKGETINFQNRKFKYNNKEFYVIQFIPSYRLFTDFLLKYPFVLLTFFPFIGEWALRKGTEHKTYKYALGFIVIKAKNLQPVEDITLAKNIYRQYCIWEDVFIDPFFKPKYIKQVNLYFELEKILNKKLTEYNYPVPQSQAEAELLSALSSLDRDLFDSYPLLKRYTRNLNSIVSFFCKISDFPEDKTIEKLKIETEKYIRTLEDLEYYIDVRKNNWLRMTDKLENYKIYLSLTKKKNFNRNLAEALLLDLVSFLMPFFSTFLAVSREVFKRFLDYVAGYKALEKAGSRYHYLRQKATNFLRLYNIELKAEFRF